MRKCRVPIFAARANMKDLRQPLNGRRRSFTMLYLSPIRNLSHPSPVSSL